LFHCIEVARNRVTPPDFTVKQQFDEISLFAALNALPPDGLLRRQLVSQKGVSTPISRFCVATGTLQVRQPSSPPTPHSSGAVI